MTSVADPDSVASNLPGVTVTQVDRYLDEMRARTKDAADENPLWREAYSQLLRAVKHSSLAQADLPAGFDPKAFPSDDEPHRLTLMQRGGSVTATSHETFDRESCGSRLAEVTTRNGVFSVSETGFWKSGAPPNWAADYGHDPYGPWTEFMVEGADGRAVRQRMRWVPPGTFRTGSAEDEEGRYGQDSSYNEGPQHDVTISKGYWLFDTPVTQALWTAVTGENYSLFRGPERPVERVSWDEALRYLEKINERVPGLDLALPTEAQWEYACRARTTGPNYAGSAEKLAEIAWFYENSKRQTHAVAQKQPNGWGLHDMLGNVWEWCADDRRAYIAESLADPVGSLESAERALRGGSWHSRASNVRAAYRFARDRDDRDNNVGFRCARVRAGAEPAESERQTAPGRQRGARLLSPAGEHGAAAVKLPKARGVVIRSDCETLTFETLTRPDWASGMGRDRHGLWAEFTIGDAVQRLRWIGPGRFMMGSPEYEPGRYDEAKDRLGRDYVEGPRHEVRITRGYWLFDTPVTQALWTAVMGENPSYFVDPQRPVEQVSWDDAQRFLETINGEISDLDLTLPTEAQWEYACRAGSDAATYAGPIEILGENNAPVLDAIAWYGGNSGVGFDLENGHDSSDWPEKQYEHSRTGTRQVKHKRANDWGLYDMLGNVWEWCADDLRTYTAEPLADPVGSLESAERALRGGSWSNDARLVRAANRSASHRGSRNLSIGFRCARVRE